jgi:uncharacterized protein (DUF302 family)
VEETRYAMKIELPVGCEEAVARAAAALKAEGFGVLTTIDVRQTLQQRIGATFRPYVILGACNPALAHQALGAEVDLGVLLPCNLAVYEAAPGRSVVAAVAPIATMGRVGNPALAPIAAQVDAKLRRVLAALEEGAVR